MIYLLDVNLLLYASFELFPDHGPAKAWFERLILTDNGTPIMQLVPLDTPPLDLAAHWQQQLDDARRIMQGKSTGASTVLEERAASKS